VETRLKEIRLRLAPVAWVLALLLISIPLAAQSTAAPGPPPSSGGFFPLSQVRKGMTATAWTVFQGTRPEPMDVEILGVLRGARGPGQDMILAQLHGTKPEYTGVVAGMSGSPVYIGNKLLGSLSYRIGQFSKDPIAGITPIEQMLEVRDLPLERSGIRDQGTGITAARGVPGAAMDFQAMETPLVMTGFQPEAVELWKKQAAGTNLETVAAGGVGGGSQPDADMTPSKAALATVVPGSAVSAQLVRGDLEIAATCTVTYIDPKQLLACGHPILQAGTVSLPMTTAEVVATLASPLNAFKIVNTGELIGTFTEDRDSAIRGVLGMTPHMIPLHITVHSGDGPADRARHVNVEVLDLPSLTAQAVLITLYQALLESNTGTDDTSYHLTGSIHLDGYADSPLDEWASAGDAGPAPLLLALQAGARFQRIYANGGRKGDVRGIDVNIEAVPRRLGVQLETARLAGSNIVHGGDTVVVEATVRNWQQPERNLRIPIKVPARMGEGNLRILVSDAGTLDRTLDQPRFSARPQSLGEVLAEARNKHDAGQLFVSILVPETQAGVEGESLTSLPLSVANALEPLRSSQDVRLNGESAEVAAQAPAGGVLSGFQILTLHIDPGGGLD